jgi:hypothetical protein
MKTALIVAVAMLMTAVAAIAGELPKSFLGNWTQDGLEPYVPAYPITITPTSLKSIGIGFSCKIDAVNGESMLLNGDETHYRVYVVDESCTYDGLPPGKQHETWALRNINGTDVLLIASNFPSLDVYHRPQSKK